MKIVLKDHASRLRALHHGPEMLVLPNAWDASSARLFAELGFPVIATSSRAVAASLGYADHEGAPREEMLAAAARIARAVDVPVTADAEAGDGLPVEDLVGRLLDAGIAGLNIEDSDHQAGTGLIDAARQADRLAAIKEAGRRSGVDLVVNARIDVFLHGGGDVAAQLAAAHTRAHAYAEAGADCVFPIGLRDSRVIEAFVQDVGVPVNILSYPGVPPLEELAALGVARVSFGGGTADVALAALRSFGEQLLASLRPAATAVHSEPPRL